MFKAAAFALMLFGAGQAGAASLITNGDFEQGATGFSTDYGVVSADDTGPKALWQEGLVTVGRDPNDYHELLSPTADHTTGHGDYLIVNGATKPDLDVWRSGNLDLGPGTYTFSVWTTNLYDKAGAAGQPDLKLFGEGEGGGPIVALSSLSTPTTTGSWQQSTYTVTLDRRLTGSLAIRDASTVAYGNDFGIDDISLVMAAPVPEPATWATTILGLGLVGGILRTARRADERFTARLRRRPRPRPARPPRGHGPARAARAGT